MLLQGHRAITSSSPGNSLDFSLYVEATFTKGLWPLDSIYYYYKKHYTMYKSWASLSFSYKPLNIDVCVHDYCYYVLDHNRWDAQTMVQTNACCNTNSEADLFHVCTRDNVFKHRKLCDHVCEELQFIWVWWCVRFVWNNCMTKSCGLSHKNTHFFPL